LVSWWRGGEATGNGADRLHGGVGRQRRAERMKKKNRENGGGRGRRHFLYGGPVARCEEEKGRGPAVWRRVEEKMRKREGGPDAAGDNSGCRHRPPAGGCRRRDCRAIGEGTET
jgi:hypothetical protein